jgi:acetyl-CoA acetyltransferase
MNSRIRDRAAIVGLGTTPFYVRGGSAPQTRLELAGKAILAALADAGLSVRDLDGFALYSKGINTALLAQTLGVPDVRFTASVTGGGGGSAGSIGLAAAAVVAGIADVVVCCMSLQQPVASRFGRVYGAGQADSKRSRGSHPAEMDFLIPSGLVGPGHGFAILAQRHMYLYGTTREHLAEVAISTRANAARRETARFRTPLTLEKYLDAPMLADPLCLYDFCMESEGAVACVVTSAERARDLPHPPAYITAAAQGGHGRWGTGISWFNMPDEYFASSGGRPIAQRLYADAGLNPTDIDVALLYDHFTPMVLMQLEDFGFCAIGESGQFVEAGNIRWPQGSLPVNTHGGNLSDAYIIGMTHVVEAVEQLRGVAINQVGGAEVALVTGGPAAMPSSALILRRA